MTPQNRPPPYLSMVSGPGIGFIKLAENTGRWYKEVYPDRPSLDPVTLEALMIPALKFITKKYNDILDNSTLTPVSDYPMSEVIKNTNSRSGGTNSNSQNHIWRLIDHIVIRMDTDKKRFGGLSALCSLYDNHKETAINPVEIEFSDVEDIVRWLGFPRIFDNPDRCLFTHSLIDAANPDDIVEVPLRVPMLDTSDAPPARIHRSILIARAWDCTSMGCDIPSPHYCPSAYFRGNRFEQTCAVTGTGFPFENNWWEGQFGGALWLIPVCEAVRVEMTRMCRGLGCPNGVPATEWNTSLFPPRLLALD